MIGYAVTVEPLLASFRLRVAIPADHLGREYVIGETGNPTFFYKLGNPELAAQCSGGIVFDVVNDHFDRFPSVRAMALMADRLTVGSQVMADIVWQHTGRDAIVIDDPYENEERPPKCGGDRVLWFGHAANLASLTPHQELLQGLRLTVMTNYVHNGFVRWSLDEERAQLEKTAIVIVTGTNPGASSNRVAKSIRAGRFVVMPEDCAEAWKQFRDYVWIGDMREGVRWALNNREEACKKIAQGQQFVREHFAPDLIGKQWREVYDSI